MRFFIKGNYYFDIDLHNQLRLAGPKNHLFLGLGFPHDLRVHVESYRLVDGDLQITLCLEAEKVQLGHPLVTDIRTLRSLVEPVVPHPTFGGLVNQDHPEILPEVVEYDVSRQVLTLLNRYDTDDDRIEEYGAKIEPINSTSLEWKDKERKILLVSDKDVRIRITTITNIENKGVLQSKIFQKNVGLEEQLVDEALSEIYQQAGIFIRHLITSGKTSSFEFGTIFPRDWLESADLAKGDLTARTLNYMYEKSMEYVSETGEGWHEDVIGHYRSRKRSGEEQLIDRKMVDIEPHYIMSMRRMSKRMLMQEEIKDKLQRVANFVISEAKERELITFKPVEGEVQNYHVVGNWRDSATAFATQRPPIAPYDVNCVFYPAALRTIKLYRDYLEIDKDVDLDSLLEKWKQQKYKFRIYHPGGLIGYALALQGTKHLQVPIAHLDESYALFYDYPTLEEVVSFATKIVDPDYFYTPGGPILVAADEEAFTSANYHGKVIWPKQVAFAVGGLARQWRRGKKLGWPDYAISATEEAILRTGEACFRAWKEIKAVPELYYFDAMEDRARLYTDQPNPEGQMSIIQLWSSVAARRIIREYTKVLAQGN